MKKIGIIVEYNPFHYGHKNHISRIKEKYPKSLLIACMSGNVVQRGQFAIFDKFERTKVALENGVDIVVELPIFYSLNSADLFAKGSIKTLNLLGVDEIIFGSESNNVDKLIQFGQKLNSKTVEKAILKKVKELHSYPKAVESVLEDLKSNDILGVNYIKWIYNINPKIKASTIKRDNDNFVSASKIRGMIYENKKINMYAPLIQEPPILMDDFLEYIIFWLKMSKSKKPIILNIKNNMKLNYSSWEDFLQFHSNKSNTKAKIGREILKEILDVNIEPDVNAFNPRLLGMTSEGRVYLNENDINLQSKYVSSMEAELKISQIIGLKQSGFIDKEIKTNVIIKK